MELVPKLNKYGTELGNVSGGLGLRLQFMFHLFGFIIGS